MSAVCQLHIHQGVPPPQISAMPCLHQVLKGIRISQSSQGGSEKRQRLPIQPDILRRIKQYWESATIDNDKVMLWTAFFGFM